METPEKGREIEWTDKIDGTFEMADTLGRRNDFGNVVACLARNGKPFCTWPVKYWRYPGETDWRR